jgi:hypothetical protein
MMKQKVKENKMAATHHVVMMQMRFMTKPASIMSGQEKTAL